MSIKSLLELSLSSINEYQKMVERNIGKNEYGSDVVSCYNTLGENIEALSSEIEDIFSDDDKYINHFEDDDIQDYLSDNLNIAFEEYLKLKNRAKCEEKIILAYEWLFEIMLFTTDDEELKSKITLSKNDIEMVDSSNTVTRELSAGDKISVRISYDSKIEDITLDIEDVVDDYIYSYLGDKENEDDLIIFNKSKVYKVK